MPEVARRRSRPGCRVSGFPRNSRRRRSAWPRRGAAKSLDRECHLPTYRRYRPEGGRTFARTPCLTGAIDEVESIHHNRAVSPRSSGAFPRGGSLASLLSRARSVPSSSRRALPVIAIGQRVFVNCPESGASGTLFLGDETGKVISAQRVADGLEVEVIAWRPRGAAETRYRVRVPSTGADGWLPAGNLRKSLVPLSAQDSPGSSPSASDAPDRRSDDRARRFGQRF